MSETDSAANDGPESASGERRIVAGIDGSEASNDALAWAARQAALTGSALEVVIAWQWPTAYGFPPYYPADFDPADDARKLLDGAVSQVRRAHPDITVQPVLIDGNAAPILVERSVGADLLVVGSRGHGEFVGMLLGSVSQHCVSNAHCPVLVYRDGRQ